MKKYIYVMFRYDGDVTNKEAMFIGTDYEFGVASLKRRCNVTKDQCEKFEAHEFDEQGELWAVDYLDGNMEQYIVYRTEDNTEL